MNHLPTAVDIAEMKSRFEAVVCIQGLGFVGSAMAVAVAGSRTPEGLPRYLVVGVERAAPEGRERAEGMMQGVLPFVSADDQLTSSLRAALDRANFVATCDEVAFELADYVIVDIHLDIDFNAFPVSANLQPFSDAVMVLAQRMSPGSLLIIETTVPPGTTQELILPMMREQLQARGLPPDSVAVAHSYERVMPGPRHLESIVDYWRVYAGVDDHSADLCRDFLETVINAEQFPLTRLVNPTASETAKVLENSYRAVIIALMDEWGKFGEQLGIDMFEVIDAIRVRPTHSNMREPGLGVGGYCLTKDPLFPQVSLNTFFPELAVDFPITDLALAVNAKMPENTALALEELLGRNLRGSRIAVMGASYRPDVDDTRHSPSESLVRTLRERGAEVWVHDPLATRWETQDVEITSKLPDTGSLDAVIFAVAHSAYRDLDLLGWLWGCNLWVIDAGRVLTREQRVTVAMVPGLRLFSIGRGFG